MVDPVDGGTDHNAGQHFQHRIGQLARQRHLRPGPVCHQPLAFLGALDVGRHLLGADVFERAPGKHKTISRAQACDEAFFHDADAPTGQVFHLHRRLRHDRSDLQLVASRDAAIGHAVHAVDQLHAVVFGVRRQARTPFLDKIEGPPELVAGQVAVGMRGANLSEQIARDDGAVIPRSATVRLRHGRKTAAEGHGNEVLNQHVQRLVGRCSLFNVTCLRRASRRHRFDQLQRVRRHQRDATRAARRVAAAPGPLQQPGHALDRADLQHPLDRQKVDPEVERRRCHHGFEPSFLQPRLDPFTHRFIQRAVVQGDHSSPIGALLQQQLIPDFGLRTHVDEHQRGAGALDLGHDRQLHLLAQMAAP